MEGVKPQGRLLDNIKGALRLAWMASPRAFVEVAILTFVTGAIPPVVVFLGKQFVDLVVAGDRGPRLVAVAIGFGATELVNQVLSAFAGYRQDMFGDRVVIEAKSRFLAKAGAIDVAHYDDPLWHDRMARAASELGWRPHQLTWSVIGIGGSFVTLIGMLGLLASLHPALVLLSLLTVVPSIVVQRRTNRRLYEFWYTRTPESRERSYLDEILSRHRWAREVRAFGLAGHLRARHDRIATHQLAVQAALYRRAQRSAALGGLLAGLALTAAYLFVAGQAAPTGLTAGDLTAVIGAFASISGRLNSLSSSLLSIDQHAVFLDDYFAFLAIEPQMPVRSNPIPLPVNLSAGIEFDRVTFAYPHGSAKAVRDLSLRVEPGELVALVGDNGAGKTTLVKLLLRFYDPDGGSVRIGGVDLRDADPNAIRTRIGVLFQDFGQFELSARENVSFGRIDREHRDDLLMAALQAARADELVRRLPQGLDAKVGRQFEGGHDLSGGEWQRLALARLIYRDADIWVLDEPTAALDAEAEAAIFSELRENLQGRMGLIISHRFSTVRMADRIAVIQDGQVTELGTHEELLARGRRYAELFEIQAAGYR
jgi:ATP-binding cassette, subfamily B, bacterial